MKTKSEIVCKTLEVLEELENTNPKPELKSYLQGKLAALFDICTEDIDEEY